MKAAVAAVAALAIAGGGVVAWHPWDDDKAAAVSAKPQDTTAVRSGSLSSTLKLSGQVGYGTPTPIAATGQGIFTVLPKPDDVVDRGERLYEVSGTPVFFFQGDRPLWRELGAGMSDGPDVKQLEKNLKELGFANGLSVDEKFTDGTADAVKRWQKAHKLEETGKIGTGQISMLPFKELRIDSVTALPGSAVGSTDAMKVTGTDVQVTVPLQETQLSQVAPGSKVTVQLPGGKKSDGTVKSVERGGSDAAPDKKPGSGDSAGTAVVTLADPGDSQAGASVSVTLADTSVDNALIVPVTSLLALSEGGYGVQVVRNGATVLVPVTIGLITDAKVQVTGGDVHEGDQVVIPK